MLLCFFQYTYSYLYKLTPFSHGVYDPYILRNFRKAVFSTSLSYCLFCIVVLVVASTTVEQEFVVSILGSGEVLLGFSVRSFLVAVTEAGFVQG